MLYACRTCVRYFVFFFFFKQKTAYDIGVRLVGSEMCIRDRVRITIPAGVADGQVIKLKGYGAEGVNGGPAGDLYITFVIAEDPVFKRLGDDLYVDVEVDLYSAVLGGEKVVDTLDGKVKLKIKPETQNGTKVRLKGKGFPVYKKEGQFGDLIVTYSVKIPTNLTDKQKELFRQLQSMN